MNEASTSPIIQQKAKRFLLLDALRGFTMLSMILYHFLWDLVYIAQIPVHWYHGTGAYIWQQSICQTFIILSGFCWSFGRQPLKRGLIVFWSGGLITLVTMLLMPENLVLFGVLTLIGSCMILMIPLDHILKNIKPTPIFVALFATVLILFIVLHPASNGYPEYAKGNLLTAYLGFPAKEFYSTDYFPLLPWFLLFVAGYLLHKLCLRLGWLEIPVLKKNLFPPLTFLGRHSLLIYMLHQPILYGITMLIILFK